MTPLDPSSWQNRHSDEVDNPLAPEIRAESAAAYFAACRRMVDSLEALKVCDVSSLAQTAEQFARRADLLAEAAERVFFVIIQREAMGFPAREEFFEDYGVPLEVRSRIEPKRRV
jgi:hypothetical protein